MPTPPKPYEVLKGEGKSHRTKAELEKRRHGEAALLTGTPLHEWLEVKANQRAHKEFQRIAKLLKKINKNDGLYESIINRYCIIQGEITDIDRQRSGIETAIEQLSNLFENKEIEPDTYFTQLTQLHKTLASLDSSLMSKRKMLFDIEKENIMTVASALRSIPKKVEDEAEDDPMAAMLAERMKQRVRRE